jgi:rRNA maturation protein Nop10
MHIVKCGKKFGVTIPTRYSAKVVMLPCGSTSIYGGVNQCPECEAKQRKPIPAAYEDEGDMEWYERVSLQEEQDEESW